MKTRYFIEQDIQEAAALLRSGELVAFPTETVYGLGADALQDSVVQKIFEAKGRPSDNPLIVHLSSTDQLSRVASSVPAVAQRLIDAFWPGPLTLVLPKGPQVSALVTAGLDTVAVRIPSDALARKLIELAGVPIAAPSANRSGRPSATTWQAVAEDLDGRIAGIVCGKPTLCGLESTVVDATSPVPRILRPGGVTWEELQQVVPDVQPYLGSVDQAPTRENSPGLKYKHYQPKAKVTIVHVPHRGLDDDETMIDNSPIRRFYIGCDAPVSIRPFAKVLVCGTVEEYAAKLFDFFRNADSCNADVVCCQSVPELGVGVALMDRLRRASHS